MPSVYEQELPQIARVQALCPACGQAVSGAAGRAFCPDCFITFPLPRKNRTQVLREFDQRYYRSTSSQYYHREGCKYLKSISKENLIVMGEPTGKPCSCVR